MGLWMEVARWPDFAIVDTASETDFFFCPLLLQLEKLERGRLWQKGSVGISDPEQSL